VITALPMFGDYYTNTLISNSPKTVMIGNSIEKTVQSGFSRAQGASLVLLLSAVLLIFMAYYLILTVRASREAR
jgi:spermidine/putrescine transport system permease protein